MSKRHGDKENCRRPCRGDGSPSVLHGPPNFLLQHGAGNTVPKISVFARLAPRVGGVPFPSSAAGRIFFEIRDLIFQAGGFFFIRSSRSVIG